MAPKWDDGGTDEPDSHMAVGQDPIFQSSRMDAIWETQAMDIHGNKFDLPVDCEHKAKPIKFLSFAKPHMRTFHLSWLSFFISFLSTFAACPLMTVIRDNLNLTKAEIATADIASVSGSIVSRLLMGTMCDLLGPRYASGILIMVTAPAVFAMPWVTSANSFILVRFCIGFALATFVTCQFWMSSMFNSKIVGFANGTAAGWGNLGGGITQLAMPLLYNLISNHFGVDDFTAWRLAFFVPGVLHIIMGLVLLTFGQDLPDGNFGELKRAENKPHDSLRKVFWIAATNYRAYIFALTYGFCFGVELTVDSVIAPYFSDRWDLDIVTAGYIAASFGLLNIVSRPLGGYLSDLVAMKFGMRGRLWTLWIIQSVGGVACIGLGICSRLGSAITVGLIFSLFVQAACGATFGIIPFVSLRSLGVVSGITAAGGNVGSVVTLVLFFLDSKYSTQTGIQLMGIAIVACTLPLFVVYFPQWGGMFAPRGTATEEEYYVSEWSEDERAKGLHLASLKFAHNTKSERGTRVAPASSPEDGKNGPLSPRSNFAPSLSKF